MSKNLSITKQYNLNGPINIYRLENNDTGKIVYIFGDHHINIGNQTKCADDFNVENMNIDTFLFKFFKENNETLFDFFYEDFTDVNPMDTEHQKNWNIKERKYTNMYFSSILMNVYNNINLIDNKIHVSKNLPNLRFHYFNFRNTLVNFIGYTTHKVYNLVNNDNYDIVIEHLTFFASKFDESLIYLKSDENKFINKIKYKYNDLKLGKKMIKLYNENIIKYGESINKMIIDTINYIKKTPKLKLREISDEEKYDLRKIIHVNLNKIDDEIITLFAFTTDLYLIRRLLDKDYIKNCIIYTGTAHMTNIIHILIKHFNYNITHVAKKDENMTVKKIQKTFNKSINNYKNKKQLNDIVNNDNFQCANLFDFPDNLL